MTITELLETVRRVEVIAFSEPRDYLPPERWLRQFDGRKLAADLAPNRGIRTLAGATLSSRAVTDCVRRVLVLVDLDGTVRRVEVIAILCEITSGESAATTLLKEKLSL